MKSIKIFLVLALCTFSFNLFAHCGDSKVYGGGGVTLNSLDGSGFDDASGYQFFAGYCTKFNFNNPKIGTSLEGGYMDSGDFERTTTRGGNGNGNNNQRTIVETQSFGGAWLSALGEYRFSPKIHLMGRLGYDAGDDSGPIMGGGAAYNISKALQLRAEYVVRDTVDSIQLNLITEF